MKQKQLKTLLAVLLLCIGTLPIYAFSSSTEFYAVKSTSSPSGSGRIYIYHAKRNNDMSVNASRPDVLQAMTDDKWSSADNALSSGEISMGDQDGDYKGDGYVYYDASTSSNSKVVLNMYFYAKPNPGYRFLGWKSTDDETMSGFATGSDRIYTNDKTKAGTYTTWNNGRGAEELPKTNPAGYYVDYDYYYLRHVDEVSQGNTADRYFYAYFELIPQQFSFGGTGEGDISYTASAGGDFSYTIGESDKAELSTATSNNIALTLGEYDTDLFRFDGWYYDYTDVSAVSHTNQLLSTATGATYVLNSDAAARSNVKIYPMFTSMSDKAAIVQFDGSKNFFDTWAEAFADALTKSATREDKDAPIIKLLSDATGLAATQTINQSLTINLNGRTISGTGNGGALIDIEGAGTEVAITDIKPGQIAMTDAATQYTYAIRVKNGASLAVSGKTSISNTNTKDNGSARGIEVQAGATLNITGGTVSSSSLQDAYAVINRANATISGGSLTATATTASMAVAILTTSNTTANTTIEGGEFTASAVTGSAYAIQTSKGTMTVNGGRFTASAPTAYGAYHSDGSLIINGGYFPESTTASVGGSVQVQGGRYIRETNIRARLTSGYNCYELEVGTDYTLGYRYEVTPTQAHPHTFKVVEQGGTSYYETLQDALAYAANTPEDLAIIQMVQEYILPAGNYSLPSYASLVVPKNIDQAGPRTSVERVGTYAKPSLYKKLILSDGVRMDVFGTLEASGTQNSQGQGSAGAGVPSGAYGQIVLESGSKIILNNGARLQAWGFITGTGEIDARRGSTVFEQFQMYDWKGGWGSNKMLGNSKKVFPVTQYFIQNIEAPVTYHPGSSLTSMTSVNVSSAIVACDMVKIIGVYGDIAMFLMDNEDDSEDTWVRKEYDAVNDKQVYKVNSSARLGSMQLTMENVPVMGTLDFNSQNYVMPVTNNLKIELLTGNMDITQNTVLLPGAEIEIDKEATVAILDKPNISYDGAIYLMDADQWAQGHVYSNAYTQQVRYSPTFGGAPNKRGHMDETTFVLDKPGDATLFVHGTFDVQGTIQTTEGGANIYSTKEDAGTIMFSNQAPTTNGSVSAFKSMSGSGSDTQVSYQDYSTTSAKLQNEVAEPTPTAGTAAGKSFCYLDIDGSGARWTMLTTDEDCFVYDEASVIYYAKPADYVALANGKTENADHTYSSADGTRTFILVTGCQWWEVEYDVESGLYYCDKNETYYYYDDSDPDPEEHMWQPKAYTITWQNWDGTTIESYDNARYGATPEYLGSTPKRTKDDYYTYDFTGWAPAVSVVTDDATYIAQYERKDRMYTIIWKDELDNTIESDYCKMGQIPVCYNAPDMTNKEWSPAVSAVTGDQIYQLTAKNNDGPFDIKFVNWNWDGTDEHALKIQSLAKDAIPEAPEAPEKEPLTDIAFAFVGWRAANNTVYASNAIPAATENAVYTATFTEQPITYTILWKNYDNSTLETDENVTPNTVPQYNSATPTKPSDADNNYTFSGWNPEVVAATANATYFAQFSATPKDKIVDNDTYDVPASTQVTVTNLIIKDDGIVNIPTTSRINATNLILEATSEASGQLIANANTNINIAGSAYFDWTMNGSTGSVRRTWYAVAVPWEVDARTGITDKATGRTLTAGRDFDLIYYNGAKRASEGNVASCWEYVQWDIQGHDKQGNPRDIDNLLHPGRLYMMYFAAEGLKTVRFEKAAGADVMYTSPLNVNAYPESTDNDNKDGGWNGIANPRTYFASLSAGSATYAQVLNNGNLDEYFAGESSPVYQTINLSESSFMVGKPLFLQATGNDPVVVNKEATAAIVTAAPRRNRVANATPEGIDAVYQLTIAADGKPSSDNLFVQMTEDEKADKYVIGKDLSKGGVAAKRAQMWVDRYNAKLSVNTQMLVNNEASYPLVIFAPAAGEYTISNVNVNEDYDLYLTLNGQAIWNLSNGGYTLSLPQGNTPGYGLRISARKSPAVATGIDEAIVDAQGNTQKVLINNQVFIIREGNVYTIDGQTVK